MPEVQKNNGKDDNQIKTRRVVYLPNNDPPELIQARFNRGLIALLDAIDYLNERREREAREGA